MQAGCPHPPAGGHEGRPYTEARSAREQGNSETRRRKSSCAAGARCFLRRDEQLPVAEGAQRDRKRGAVVSSGTVSRAGRKTGRAKSGGISGGAGNSDRVANRWSVTESAEPSEADGPMWAEGELPRRGKRSRPGASAPTGTRPEPRQFRPAAVCGGPAQASTAQTLSGSAGNQPGAVRRSIDARRPMRAATAFRSCRHRTTYRRPAPRGPGPQPRRLFAPFRRGKGARRRHDQPTVSSK